MYEKIFRIRWNDNLGRDWINIYNLELCLFSKTAISGKAKNMVEITDLTKKRVEENYEE